MAVRQVVRLETPFVLVELGAAHAPPSAGLGHVPQGFRQLQGAQAPSNHLLLGNGHTRFLPAGGGRGNRAQATPSLRSPGHPPTLLIVREED